MKDNLSKITTPFQAFVAKKLCSCLYNFYMIDVLNLPPWMSIGILQLKKKYSSILGGQLQELKVV